MISICMPYYERIKALTQTLKSYEKCNYKNIEVIICDDGSIKEPVPDDINDNYSYNIKVIKLPKKAVWKSPTLPLNTAVKNSNYEILLLTSPETFHRYPIINDMKKLLKNPKDVILIAARNMKNGKLENWLAHPVFKPRKFWWCKMMHKSFFNEIGGFDEKYREYSAYEDADFANRLDKAGANWKWVKNKFVIHLYLGDFDGKSTFAHNSPNKLIYEKDYGKIQ